MEVQEVDAPGTLGTLKKSWLSSSLLRSMIRARLKAQKHGDLSVRMLCRISVISNETH